jgi:3-oxoacyl-[acyl-carrier protein] reductase
LEPSLQGKIALVTGGGTGIGREIALALGRAGARVALSGRRSEPLEAVAAELRALDAQARAIVADVRNPASVQQMVETTERELGPIDILVNNAATFARGEVVQLDLERWNDVIATNLTGSFLTAQAVVGQMSVMGLAHSLLNEVRRHDIRVVVVAPSAIDTRAETPDPGPVEGVKPHASDVAATVLHCLTLPARTMIRDVEIWGTNP